MLTTPYRLIQKSTRRTIYIVKHSLTPGKYVKQDVGRLRGNRITVHYLVRHKEIVLSDKTVLLYIKSDIFCAGS